MVEKKQNKNRHFNFRVNEKEYNKIKSQIEKSKLNTSEYLLRTAMDKDIIVVDGLEEIIMQLRKIGNNINQLTKLCNQGRIRNINLEDVKKEMKRLDYTKVSVKLKKSEWRDEWFIYLEASCIL